MLVTPSNEFKFEGRLEIESAAGAETPGAVVSGGGAWTSGCFRVMPSPEPLTRKLLAEKSRAAAGAASENSMQPKEIAVRNFKIDPKEIVFIKAVLESYEGMVVMRTLEVGKPVIELLIAHDFAPTIGRVIGELQSQVLMEEVSRPADAPEW
jgi:hypothetical protein